VVALHVTPPVHELTPRHAALHEVLPQVTAPMQALVPSQQSVLVVAPLVTLPAQAAMPPHRTLQVWLAGAHVMSPAHVLLAVHPTLQVAAAHCTVLAHAPMPLQATSHSLVAVQWMSPRHDPVPHWIVHADPAQVMFLLQAEIPLQSTLQVEA